MLIVTKDLVSNTVLSDSNSIENLSTELQLLSDAKLVTRTTATRSNPIANSDACKSMSLLQRYSQQTKLEQLIEQKSTIMTPKQIQRIQACAQRVTAILHEYISTREG